jgi:hypothetical protein
MSSADALAGREDVSRFVIHLTRNDKQDFRNGGSARKNFLKILPFINAMHERYDFTWEREWRVRERLRFKLSDLVCVILPSDGADDIKEACAKSGLAAVSPGWTYEQIVTELAKQQSATKFYWKNVKKD